MNRAEFEASVRATASLTEKQYAAIFAAAGMYAACLAEITARPPDRLDRRAS
jgi:phytoene/squalene synthetase